MKTAQTIAQQEAIAETNSVQTPKYKRGQNPNSLRNLVAPWTKGNHPKGGRPPDRAACLARQVIENNEEEIYKGLATKAMAGDAYAFSVLSDRGYGKLKQGIVHIGDEDGGPVRTSLTVEFVKSDGGK